MTHMIGLRYYRMENGQIGYLDCCRFGDDGRIIGNVAMNLVGEWNYLKLVQCPECKSVVLIGG